MMDQMELKKQDFHTDYEYSYDSSNILRNFLRLGYHLGVFPYCVPQPRADGDDSAASTQKLNVIPLILAEI